MTVPLTENWVNGLAKVDYRRSERNSFTGSFNALNAKAPNGGNVYDQIAPDGGMLGLQNSTDDVRYGKAAWTSAPTRSTLNEIRAGISGRQAHRSRLHARPFHGRRRGEPDGRHRRQSAFQHHGAR